MAYQFLRPRYLETGCETVFFTSAMLQDVVKITQCRHADKLGVSCMLLIYADGRRERLGEVWLDGLQQSAMAAERDMMLLGFKHDDVQTEDFCPCVAKMAFEPLGMVLEDVLVVSLMGRLE